jgi:hypothetical protein
VPVDVVVPLPLLERELELVVLEVEPVLVLLVVPVPVLTVPVVAPVLVALTAVPTVAVAVVALVPVALFPTVPLAPPEPTAPGFSQLQGGSGVGLKHAHLFPGPRQLTAIARMAPDTAQATVRRARGLLEVVTLIPRSRNFVARNPADEAGPLHQSAPCVPRGDPGKETLLSREG